MFQIGSETFSASAKKMTSPGFTLIMPWLSFKDTGLPDLDKHIGTLYINIQSQLPFSINAEREWCYDLNAGATFTVAEVKLREGQTSPPDYLSESELIEQVIYITNNTYSTYT